MHGTQTTQQGDKVVFERWPSLKRLGRGRPKRSRRKMPQSEIYGTEVQSAVGLKRLVGRNRLQGSRPANDYLHTLFSMMFRHGNTWCGQTLENRQ